MTIFLLHTVRPGHNLFEAQINERFPGHKIFNMLDDYWIREVIANNGEFTEECMLHLLQVCASMQQAGADIIVCTCSSLTAHMPKVREFIRIPIVQIDETMPRVALEHGPRILIVSSADSAVASALEMIEAEAEKTGAACRIEALVRDDAGQIMRGGGDMAEHDRIFMEAAKEHLAGNEYDVVVMCQLSTAHLGERIQAMTKARVITTPELCFEDLKNYL